MKHLLNFTRVLVCASILVGEVAYAAIPSAAIGSLKHPQGDFDPACPLQCITTCFTVEPCVSICVLTQCVLQMGHDKGAKKGTDRMK
jgi:hypothetical protein